MMRHLLLPILFFNLAFAACNQDDDDEPTPTPTTVEVRVDGVAPVVLEPGGYANLVLAVTSTGGKPATALTITGLPQGVASYINQNSNVPPFSAELVLQANSNVVPGTTDTAIITASASGAATQTYSLPVTIKSCLDRYAGAYNVVQSCGGSGASVFTSTIAPDSAVLTRVRITNFKNSGYTVFAEVDCSFGGFTIPLQAPAGASFTVQGSGSLSGSTLSLQYSTTPLGSSGNSTYCNASYTR